jgi:quinoprotein glucose dehydrogenase
MNRKIRIAVLAGGILGLLVTNRGGYWWAFAAPATTRNVDWQVYGGQAAGDRYSALTQINQNNVQNLQVVWTYNTGDTAGGIQTQPLIIDRRMFIFTTTQTVAALDAVTGRVLWKFDSGLQSGLPARGFSYWTDGRQKVLFASVLYNLWALDPETGKTIATFGDGGKIDLREDLGPESPKGLVAITTPGVIYKDMIITGFRTGEAKPAVHGDIRAYDVHTGKLRWAFHTIPHPGEPGYETWPKDAWKYAGAANNWAGMVVDEKRGIVYAPTGSAASDFYGADRAGNDLYANTLLALDGNTGKLIWYFQGVHHDMWDRDFPSPPALVTVKHDGKSVDAVAQPTKQGVLYLFNRVTGKPLFPIEEHPFPASTVPGEWSSPTQPLPSVPEPYARQRLTEDMLTTRTPEAHAWAVQQFQTFRSGGQFLPFALDKQTVIFPGYDGGAEYGGSAVDPTTGVIYINANDVAWTGGLTEAKATGGVGSTLYQSNCAGCHGQDRAGTPPTFPSLVEATGRMTPEQMVEIIHNGRGRMPAFPEIIDTRLEALLNYVRTGHDADTGGEGATAPHTDRQGPDMEGYLDKYRFTGYRKFSDPEGYPAIVPPWGTLNAIDLNTGKYLWKIPFGEYPELVAKGMKNTGSENYGGPIVTASGLIIIAATIYDHKIHAYDSRTGKLLWQHELPYAGNATPATYMIDGKQYIVIGTSNGKNRTGPQGAAYVVFALP